MERQLMNFAGLISIAFGIFAICGAYFNWNFFMNSRKARTFSMLLGRMGTRIFYSLLGLGLVIFGVLFMMGIV